jgi:hypothetical protein
MKLTHSLKGIGPSVQKPVTFKQHAVRLALESMQMDLQIQELDQKADGQLAQMTSMNNLRDIAACLRKSPEFKSTLLGLVDETDQLSKILGINCLMASAPEIVSSITHLLADAEVAEAEKEEKEVKVEVTVNVDTDKEDETVTEVTVPAADDTGAMPVTASTEGDLESGKLPDAADKISTKEGDVSDDPIIEKDPEVIKPVVETDPKIVTPDAITAEAVEELITADDDEAEGDDADDATEFDDDDDTDIVEGAAAEVDQIYDFTAPAETVDGESMEDLGDIKIDDPEVVAPVEVEEVASPGTEKPNTDVKPIEVPDGETPAASDPEKVATENLSVSTEMVPIASIILVSGVSAAIVAALIWKLVLLVIVVDVVITMWSRTIKHMLSVVYKLKAKTSGIKPDNDKFKAHKAKAFVATQQASIVAALDKIGVLMTANMSSGFTKIDNSVIVAQFSNVGLSINPGTGKASPRSGWEPQSSTYGGLGYSAQDVIGMGKHIENILVNCIKSLEALKKAKATAKAHLAAAKTKVDSGKMSDPAFQKQKSEITQKIVVFGKLYRLYVKEAKRAALFYITACKRIV